MAAIPAGEKTTEFVANLNQLCYELERFGRNSEALYSISKDGVIVHIKLSNHQLYN